MPQIFQHCCLCRGFLELSCLIVKHVPSEFCRALTDLFACSDYERYITGDLLNRFETLSKDSPSVGSMLNFLVAHHDTP